MYRSLEVLLESRLYGRNTIRMVRLMLLLLVVAPMILISCAGTGQKEYILTTAIRGKKYKETIKVDAGKEFEIYNLTEATSGKGAGVIFYDFKKNWTMIKSPKAKSCFLKTSMEEGVLRPADFQKGLKLGRKSSKSKSVERLEVVDEIKDRSVLSKEMADLCANLSIYRVTKLNENDMDQMDEADEESDVAQKPGNVKRGCTVKKFTSCFDVYTRSCGWWSCATYKKRVCKDFFKTECT